MPDTIKLPKLTKDQQTYLEDIKRHSKPPTEKEKANSLIPGPNFDRGMSPNYFQNRAAAKVRKWTFDPAKNMYRDKDGALVADQFGQLL